MAQKEDKNKYLAAVLAYFFGGFGVHRFYLGEYGRGVVYLLFFWTFIPFIVSFFEIFYFLFMSDEVFNRRYNGANALPNNAPRGALPPPNAYYYVPQGGTPPAHAAPLYSQYPVSYTPSSLSQNLDGCDGSVAVATHRVTPSPAYRPSRGENGSASCQ